MSEGASNQRDELHRIGYPRWERALLGDNSMGGTYRMLAYALAFVVVFGSVFYFLG